MNTERDEDGKLVGGVTGKGFKKGHSGNYAGRPRDLPFLRKEARKLGPEALTVLAEIMRDEDARVASRVRAAREILDRGYGRPPQELQLVGSDDAPPVRFEAMLGALGTEDLRRLRELLAKAEAAGAGS